jgi:hypothetical protein
MAIVEIDTHYLDIFIIDEESRSYGASFSNVLLISLLVVLLDGI